MTEDSSAQKSRPPGEYRDQLAKILNHLTVNDIAIESKVDTKFFKVVEEQIKNLLPFE
jgi:hypothetical protein